MSQRARSQEQQTNTMYTKMSSHQQKTVNEYKHKKALHQEIRAAKLLANKKETTKATLHYDSTTRSRIDGEWPYLILNFMDKNPDNCNMISLRPLFFAFENRQQITKLVVETLQRLAATTQGSFSAEYMWENINAFMTDAASKNLKVESEVAGILKSDHVPYIYYANHIPVKSLTTLI
jgi:hypothetical protein